MKFKFRPQTGILVAGLLAATYAEACYYQGTSAVCITSGTAVDAINWNNSGQTKTVTASADWLVYAQPGYHLVWTGSGAGGFWGYGGDGGWLQGACIGPVHFLDASGNTASVASWSWGSVDADFNYQNGPWTPANSGIYAGTTDATSGTCQ